MVTAGIDELGIEARVGRAGRYVAANWPVLLVGALTLANGLLVALCALLTPWRSNPRFFDLPLPYGIYGWGKLTSLVFGYLLAYLSFHLFQRRRNAWWVAVGGLALSTIIHFGRGHEVYLAAVPAATLALLILFRRRFRVRSEPSSMLWGARFMVASLATSLLLGFLGFYLLDRREFGQDFNALDSLVRALREYVLVGNNDLVPRTRYAVWVTDAIRALGCAGFIAALYSLFRPVAFRLEVLPYERARTARLLERYGRIPEHYFATWPDKSYFFGRRRSGVIAYRTDSGIAVGLGDPLCSEDELPALVQEFRAFCADNGWKAAFVYSAPGLGPSYEKLGMRSLKIGADAVVDLERFCTETSRRKEFRKFRRRFNERGYSVIRAQPPHAPGLARDLEAVSREWLNMPGHDEHGFAVGQFSLEYADRVPLFLVIDPGHRCAAFVSEQPSYNDGMATIDMMRHRLDLPTGTMDFLFTEMFFLLRAEGYRTFNMGLAPMVAELGAASETLEERVVRAVFARVNRFSYRGLLSYKAKFCPEWSDRFLVYESTPGALVRTGVAISRII